MVQNLNIDIIVFILLNMKKLTIARKLFKIIYITKISNISIRITAENSKTSGIFAGI